MDLSDFLSRSPEDQARAVAELKGLIGILESKREDARDATVVWIVNRHGIRDVCVYRHWRTYLSRRPEMGCRLLDPHEVIEEEAKVAQGVAVRAEKARLWARLPFKRRDEFRGPDALSLADLREMVERADPVEQFVALTARAREMEEQGPARKRVRGRPKKEAAAAVGAEG